MIGRSNNILYVILTAFLLAMLFGDVKDVNAEESTTVSVETTDSDQYKSDSDYLYPLDGVTLYGFVSADSTPNGVSNVVAYYVASQSGEYGAVYTAGYYSFGSGGSKADVESKKCFNSGGGNNPVTRTKTKTFWFTSNKEVSTTIYAR